MFIDARDEKKLNGILDNIESGLKKEYGRDEMEWDAVIQMAQHLFTEKAGDFMHRQLKDLSPTELNKIADIAKKKKEAPRLSGV